MTQSFFQFHSPWYFLLFILAAGLFVFDLVKLHVLKLGFSSLDLVKSAPPTTRVRLEFVPPLIRFLALGLLVIALARPQWGNRYTEINSDGVDIMLAVDTSGSMRALDLKLNDGEANRLEVIKSVVADFVSGRKYDRLGMVVFGTQAYTQCPLTLDYDILKGFLAQIEIGIAGGEETAVGDALATALKRLSSSQAKSKVIILLTDGENNAGKVSPLKVAELAKERGIKVYTIGVGTNGRVPVAQQTLFGWRKVYAEFPLDEKTLKKIADTTGGQYFHADDTNKLIGIYKEIDQLEKTEVKVNEFSEFDEMYVLFVIPAAALLVLAWLLQRTVFLRIP